MHKLVNKRCIDCPEILMQVSVLKLRCTPCAHTRKLKSIKAWQDRNPDKVSGYRQATNKRLRVGTAYRAKNEPIKCRCGAILKGKTRHKKTCNLCKQVINRASARKYGAIVSARTRLAKPAGATDSDWVANYKEVVKLRLRGWSYQKIGENQGVTRQRVQQILEKEAPELVGKVTWGDDS